MSIASEMLRWHLLVPQRCMRGGLWLLPLATGMHQWELSMWEQLLRRPLRGLRI